MCSTREHVARRPCCQATAGTPSEKLFEELFLADESVTGTDHPKVMRARHDQLDHADPAARLTTIGRHSDEVPIVQ